jgi:hypothetical protein
MCIRLYKSINYNPTHFKKKKRVKHELISYCIKIGGLKVVCLCYDLKMKGFVTLLFISVDIELNNNEMLNS